MITVFDDILDFLKIETGKLDLEPRPFFTGQKTSHTFSTGIEAYFLKSSTD